MRIKANWFFRFLLGVALLWGCCGAANAVVPTCALTVNPSVIAPGESSTLTANCTDAPTSYVWDGACAGSMSVCVVTPSVTTNYTVTGVNVSGAGNTASATVTVATPICTLTASPILIAPNGSSTLTASCSPAATSYSWVGGTCAGNTTSTCTVTLSSGSQWYAVHGNNAAGAGVPTPGVTVTVEQPPLPVCTLTASPISIAPNGSSTLSASCSPAATSYYWVGGTCYGNTTSTCTVTLSSGSQVYSVHGINAAGTGETSPLVTVTVEQTAQPGCTLVIGAGGYGAPTATLSALCNPVATSYIWSDPGCSSASEFCTVAPTGTTIYTVTGVNASGAGNTASIIVPAGAPPICTLTASPISIAPGESSTLTASCTYSPTSYVWGGACAGSMSVCVVTPSETTNYTVTGVNVFGAGTTASAMVMVATPICTLTASPPVIAPGGSSTLTASCSPAATFYSWAGGTCAGNTTSTCTVTLSSGSQWYAVLGYNAGYNTAGAGVPTFTVTVTVEQTAQPGCTLVINSAGAGTAAPTATMLTALCTPQATSFIWSDPSCSSTAFFCIVEPTVTTTYTVAGVNASGAGNIASITVAVATPICTLTASPTSIAPGESSILTASCSPAAISYNWTGGTCAGNTTSTCTVTMPSGILHWLTYTVAGVSANGVGNTASAMVAPATPICTLTASPPVIAPYGSSTLTASCSPAATSYGWTGGACIGNTTSTCTVTLSSGSQMYSVFGLNAAGAGVPTPGVTVTVEQSAQPICTLVINSAGAGTAAPTATMLTALCTPQATSFIWSDPSCSSTAFFCIVEPTVTTTYTVAGVNASGVGNTASVTVTVKQTNPLLPLLTVTQSDTDSGTVVSAPSGINCGTDCSEIYSGGTLVSLTATPASGNYFFGWSGDCTGTGSCMVTMGAAKNVTATFKPVPFVAATTSTITETSATITTTITFETTDVGKPVEVYITAWMPANALGALSTLSAPINKALSVTTTRDNPYLGGQINTRQEALGTVLAAADSSTFVLVQLTSSGWQLVENGQLIPYASGVLGDSMAALNILNNANPASLTGAQFCVGYGTNAAEMIAAGRMMPVAAIDSGSTVAASGSCNVAAGVGAIEFYHAGINHYFMTAYTDEAVSLDNKPEWNWARTSKTSNVWLTRASAPSNASPVCRFYGVFSNGTVGSHFYTVDATECDMVKGRLDWGWNYEGDAFYAVKPASGTCPSGTAPVYRAYNNGMGGAPNHRYMTNQAEVDAMVAQGWVSEGTAFCGVQ